MKKVLLIVALVALMATPSFALIAGSSHDFSNQGWSAGEICVACHTPHNSDTTVALAPLWNHELTQAAFTLYDGTTGVQATGISRLCLSCHDGTVALDSFGGQTGSTKLLTTNPKNLGTDLTNDHPVMVTYDAAAAGFKTIANADVELFAGKVECASCHDVHNGKGFNNLLVTSNAASALCTSCHAK